MKTNIKIAITEFGEEYTSLSRIGDIDFDVLMIGSNFVRNVDTNTKKSGIVRSLIDLAKNLGVQEICEHVTTKEQLQTLNKLGCYTVEGPINGPVQTFKDIFNE